jgi:hypothetical protein
MKNLLLRTLAAFAALFGLASCVGIPLPMDAYSDPGPTRGGYYDSSSSSGYYDDGSYYSPSYSRPSTFYGGGLSTGYGYGRGSYGVCSTCRRSPCCCSNGRTTYRNYDQHSSHHDTHSATGHDDHRHGTTRKSSSSGSSNSSDTKWRYSGSAPRGSSKPQGNHSREWFKDRGYSLKKLQKVD